MIPASTSNRTSVMPDLAEAWSWTLRNGPSAGLEVLVNFALPYLAYKLGKSSLGDVGALMAASAPPIAWSIREFARHRRVDALSILALFGLALSLLAFIGGGGARFLQLREQLVFVAIGLVFLGSAAIGKPLIYLLARARIKRRSLAEAQSFESMRDNPAFRRAMLQMTLAWGTSLVVEASISCALLFTLTIDQYLVISPIMGYSALGVLTAWTFWYAKRAIGRVRAQRE